MKQIINIYKYVVLSVVVKAHLIIERTNKKKTNKTKIYLKTEWIKTKSKISINKFISQKKKKETNFKQLVLTLVILITHIFQI